MIDYKPFFDTLVEHLTEAFGEPDSIFWMSNANGGYMTFCHEGTYLHVDFGRNFRGFQLTAHDNHEEWSAWVGLPSGAEDYARRIGERFLRTE